MFNQWFVPASGRKIVYPASVFDPLTARAAGALGYEAMMLAGSSAALTILGAPDYILVTGTELADLARRICAACSLPLMVDADHGFGNALNCARTVELLAQAGVRGITIEDTALPAAMGQQGKAALVPLEEGRWRIAAAVTTAEGTETAIVGRTSAAIVAGPEEMLERMRAYADLGVDALFPVGLQHMRDLEALARVSTLPVMLSSLPVDCEGEDALADCGVKLVLTRHLPIQASIQAAYTALADLRETPMAAEVSAPAAAPALLAALTRQDEWARMLSPLPKKG